MLREPGKNSATKLTASDSSPGEMNSGGVPGNCLARPDRLVYVLVHLLSRV